MTGNQPPSLLEVKRRLSSAGTSQSTERAGLQDKERSPPGTDNEGLAAISESEEDSEQSAGLPLEDVWKELTIKSGYLLKKGERRRAWQKRYFVLRPKRFGYYKDEKEYKLLREVPLTAVRTCAAVQVKKHDHVFGIVTPGRTFWVQAASDEEMQDWVVKIEQVAKAAKRAREEEASSTSATDPATPHGPGDLTPQQSRPIPIAAAAPTPVGYPDGLSGSYMSSALSISSAVSDPDAAMSSSYTSSLSVPPNSLAVATGFPPPPVELASLDHRLSGLSVATSPNGSRLGHPHRPSSPGVLSSSEEDDEPLSSPLPHSQGSYVPMQLPDKDKIILSGYLTKQGKRKNWRKRWFTLTSDNLSYSKSHMDNKVHAQIPLARVLDVMEYEPSKTPNPTQSSFAAHAHAEPGPSSTDAVRKGYEHCFQIITPKRTLKLCATDEEAEIKWISAIRVLLSATRRNSEATPSSPIHLPRILQKQAAERAEGWGPTSTEGSPERKGTATLQRHSIAAMPVPTQTLALPSSDKNSRSLSNPQMPSIEGQLQKPPPPAAVARSPSQGQGTTEKPTHGRQRSATQIGREAVEAVDRYFSTQRPTPLQKEPVH